VEQVQTHGGIKPVNGIPNLFENLNRTVLVILRTMTSSVIYEI